MLNLTAWRVTLGLTQAEAAARIGVALRTYSAWERGEREPSALALKLIETIIPAGWGASAGTTAAEPGETPSNPPARRGGRVR